MKKGDFCFKKFKDRLIPLILEEDYDKNALWITCSGGNKHLNHNLIPFNQSDLPKKSHVRKKYKKDDKIYWVGAGSGNLYYGEIFKKITDTSYVTKSCEFLHYNVDFIIPTNWWILHRNCKLAIYETSKCLLRLGIYKDLRVLLMKYIWETRNDEEWEKRIKF